MVHGTSWRGLANDGRRPRDGSRLAGFALGRDDSECCVAAPERYRPQRYFVTPQWPGQFLGEAWCLSTWPVSVAVCVALGQAVVASAEAGFRRAAAPIKKAMTSIVRVLS